MKTYWFEIILAAHPLSFDDLAEKSFAAGCDDGTISSQGDTTIIGFAREAESLDSAIASAVKQVESMGCVISKIEIDNLTALREVA